MTLGEKIQELRRKNAMSQDVLAEKLEVSRQAVSKWERDEAMPETKVPTIRGRMVRPTAVVTNSASIKSLASSGSVSW